MENIAIILRSLFAILAMIFLWQACIRRYLLDSFRQRLFEIRDNLFDYALENKIPFSIDVYVRLRMAINARIRYAHRITLIDLLGGLIFANKMRPVVEEEENKFKNGLAQLSEEHRKHFVEVKERFDKETAFFFLRSNPVVFIAVFFVVLVMFIYFFLLRIPFSFLDNQLDRWANHLEPFWDVSMAEGDIIRLQIQGRRELSKR